MKKLKIVLSFLMFALFTFQLVKSLGVTQPILEKGSMLRGETSRFYFEIQTVGYSTKQSCVWSMNGLSPLEITFDQSNALVDAGSVKKIYGTVSVASTTPYKSYSGTLTVTCGPNEESGGGSTIKRTVNVPFVVSVVETLENRAEQKLPSPEKEKLSINLLLIPLIIILLVLVICLVYWFKKKKK